MCVPLAHTSLISLHFTLSVYVAFHSEGDGRAAARVRAQIAALEVRDVAHRDELRAMNLQVDVVGGDGGENNSGEAAGRRRVSVRALRPGE